MPSLAHHQTSNNDRMIAAQVLGGVRKSTGEVKIEFFGNMAVKLTSPRGLELFVDPWRNLPAFQHTSNMWFQLDLPYTRADIALVTHCHHDHDAIDRLDATMVLDRMVGSFEIGDVKIVGIADKHVCEPQGKYAYRSMVIEATGHDPCEPGDTLQWNNSIYVIETGGLRIVHWGDNRQNPHDYVWEMIGEVDVAFLPVSDDGHILSHRWADIVMERMNPRIAIPTHYSVAGVNVANAGGVESAIQWVESHEHTMLPSASLLVSPESARKYKQHVFYFGDHVAFDVHPQVPGFVRSTELPAVPEPLKVWERFEV